MKLSNNKELWGFRLELLGLIFLLIGGFWQANFSGWWDKQIPEWQYYIQHEVNLAILSSLQNISDLQVTEDKDLKEKIAKNVIERTSEAYSLSINERDKRHTAMSTGQAATFWSIQGNFVFFGALFLVLGKWLAFTGVKERLSNNEKMLKE